VEGVRKMLNLDTVKKQIATALDAAPRPLKVTLFGSLARGTSGEDSDIDLVVILNKEGKSDSYKAMISARMDIAKRLRTLRRKYPIDILVYTKEEWEDLKSSGSSFITKIEQEGVAVL
jgi:predicted nucleotidyltransferase